MGDCLACRETARAGHKIRGRFMDLGLDLVREEGAVR